VPNQTGAGKQVMLATVAGGHIRLRHTGPEVPHFSAQAESTDESYIHTRTNLEYPSGGSGFAWVFPSEE
jgi:hypothetical protein